MRGLMTSYTWREIELAEPAWHYPVGRGGITHSCGHREPFPHDTGEPVVLATWDEYGNRSAMYADYCAQCALRAKISGYFLPDEEAVDLWMG